MRVRRRLPHPSPTEGGDERGRPDTLPQSYRQNALGHPDAHAKGLPVSAVRAALGALPPPRSEDTESEVVYTRVHNCVHVGIQECTRVYTL